MSDNSSVVLKSSMIMNEFYSKASGVILNLIFSPIGNVASICSTKVENKKKSTCYAYVNYTSLEEAQVALDKMDYDHIYGKSIRILWYKDPFMSGRMKIKIIMEDLDPLIAKGILYDTILNFYKMSKRKTPHDEKEMSKYSELKGFESGINISTILKIMTELRISDFELLVSRFQVFLPFIHEIVNIFEPMIRYKEDSYNLYVKNFPKTYSDEQFLKIFDEYGEIESGLVMRYDNGESRGFGFVSFEDEDSAKKAIEHLHNNVYIYGQKQPLYVAFAEKKAKRVEKLKKLHGGGQNLKTNIYVKNLNRFITESDLRELFEPFGEIKSCILLKRFDIYTAAALINYYRDEDAKKAIDAMNGTPHSNELLYVAYAQTKEERLKHLSDIQIIGEEEYCQSQMNCVHYQYFYPSFIVQPSFIVLNPVSQVLDNPPMLERDEPIYDTDMEQNTSDNFDYIPNDTQPRTEDRATSIGSDDLDCSDFVSKKLSRTIYEDPIIQINNPTFHLYAEEVYNKVEKINTKWAQRITEVMLRTETPVLKQLLLDETKFNEEVNAYIELFED